MNKPIYKAVAGPQESVYSSVAARLALIEERLRAMERGRYGTLPPDEEEHAAFLAAIRPKQENDE